MTKTISEQIVNSVGTGSDPAILDTLEALSTAELGILDGLTASTAELNIMDGVTATAAEINAAADVSGRAVAPGDVAAYTVLAANSGKVHYIGDLTADCTFTLPAAAAGLEFRFVSTMLGTADAQDWIFDTGSDTNFYVGGLKWIDPADDTTDMVYPNGSSNSKMSVIVPAGGTDITLFCDGTHWIIMGAAVAASTATFADQ